MPLEPQEIDQSILRQKTLVSNSYLEKPIDLFLQSLTADDQFRTFSSTWSALEIFVGAAFSKLYGRIRFDQLASGAPVAAKSYFKRAEDVMRARHTLIDKFTVIASLLDEESAETDIAEFRRIKKVRDRIFHGDERDSNSLPSVETQALFLKYLSRHLDYHPPA